MLRVPLRRAAACLLRRSAERVWWRERGSGGRLVVGEVAGRGGRELLGQHRRATRRREGGSDEHHRQPEHRSALVSAHRRRCAWRAAQIAIVNGIGYDDWASKLLAANPVSGRAGARRGRPAWAEGRRQPAPVVLPGLGSAGDQRDRRRLREARPAGQGVLRGAADALRDRLAEAVQPARAEIRKRFAGVPVGYSESIFQPLGNDLHLKLLTPYSFTKAIAEGTDVSATGHADGRQPGAGRARSRSGSTTARTPRPTSSRSTRSRSRSTSRSRRSPRRSHRPR